MVVNNLHDLCIFNPGYCLVLFIVIHQHNPLSLGSQQVSSGNHTQITSILIQNREIPVTFIRHNVPDLVNIIITLKGNQVLSRHKIADGHALVNETGRRIGIIGCGNDRTAPLLSNLFDGHRHSGSLADNDAVCTHFNGAQLGFIPVSQDHQIMGLNVKLHQIRVRCRDQHLSLAEISVCRTDHQICLQGLNNIGILGIGLGQNTAVINIHIGLCNIAYGDQSLQGAVLPHGRNGDHVIFLHDIPGPF